VARNPISIVQKEKLERDEVLSLIGFAKNYSFKHQNEVQEEHWCNFQLSILVHIVYTTNPECDILDPWSPCLKT
jgi:hypothetical protein